MFEKLRMRLQLERVIRSKSPEKRYQILKGEVTKVLDSGDRSAKALYWLDTFCIPFAGTTAHSSIAKQFFTEDRITEISGLLEKATEYLKGTIYEKRALKRPQGFRDIAYSLLSSADALERVGCLG